MKFLDVILGVWMLAVLVWLTGLTWIVGMLASDRSEQFRAAREFWKVL